MTLNFRESPFFCWLRKTRTIPGTITRSIHSLRTGLRFAPSFLLSFTYSYFFPFMIPAAPRSTQHFRLAWSASKNLDFSCPRHHPGLCCRVIPPQESPFRRPGSAAPAWQSQPLVGDFMGGKLSQVDGSRRVASEIPSHPPALQLPALRHRKASAQ